MLVIPEKERILEQDDSRRIELEARMLCEELIRENEKDHDLLEGTLPALESDAADWVRSGSQLADIRSVVFRETLRRIARFTCHALGESASCRVPIIH